MKRDIFAALTLALLFAAAGAIAQQRIETIVTLCDNGTELVIAGLKPGQALERGAAFQVADKFMGEWKKKNPGSNWIMAQNLAPGPPVAMQVRRARTFVRH